MCPKAPGRRFPAILVVLLLWGASAARLDAQVAPADFFGGTVVAGGAPLPDAFVQLENLNGEHVATVFTDADGSFRFERLASNNNFVYVIVDEAGFEPYRERLELPYVLGGVVTIYLEPEAGREGPSPAVVDLSQLQADVPDEARDAYGEARRAADGGDSARAVELLERALERAPDFFEARIAVGGHYSRLGRYAEAEAAYRRAWETNPGSELAPLNLGVLYYEQAERAIAAGNASDAGALLDQAGPLLDEAINRNPVSADARFYMGAALYRVAAYDLAEVELLESLELDPREGQARLVLINVYQGMGRLDAALDQADRFIEENPDSPQRADIESVRSRIEAALRQ